MTRRKQREMRQGEKRVAVGMALLTLALVALAGLAIYLVADNSAQTHAIEELRAESQKRGEAITALANDSTKLREKLAREGVNPNTVAPPPEKRVSDPPTVISNTIIERPSDAQVRTAVAVVLKENPTLTQAQIITAVTAYLKANPPKDGQDGATGPGPSQEQVDAAVAEYCSDNNCDGPQGPSGPTGADGKNAFPFEFHFKLPDQGPLAGAAYTCVIVDPATPALCTQDGSG